MSKKLLQKNGAGLATLLETKNPTEQAARVQNLLRIANAPVFELLIRYDGRNGQTALFAVENIPFNTIYAMLDEARSLVRVKELENMKAPAADITERPAP